MEPRDMNSLQAVSLLRSQRAGNFILQDIYNPLISLKSIL